MTQSPLLERLRDEQRDEMMKRTPAERLMMALELSDACGELHNAAREAIELSRPKFPPTEKV